jgi:hypothetical protein
MVLGSIQPLIEMSTSDVSWGGGGGVKAAGGVGLIILTHYVPIAQIVGASLSWNPKGLSGPA